MPHSVLTLRCRYGEIEDLTAQLWERGTAGLQEIELDGGTYEIQAYFDEAFDASLMPGYIGWHQAQERLNETWQSAWEPIEVGIKLWLAPHWTVAEPPQGRIRVNIHPGQGSGTGYSEPTLLMLEILERELQPGDTFIDVGTGSGILTAAAHALGARRLFACDVDATAAAEATSTLAADGIAAHLWCGSPRSLASYQANFVVANLNAIQLEGLTGDLMRILAPSGRLLVGGFTERNLARVQALFPGSTQHFTRGPWRALLS
jgi:ribosomal protein L11 methyltransferase